MSDVSKKARRDAAREHARELREIERKRKQRNGLIIKGGVVLGAIAVALVVVLVVQQIAKDNEPAVPTAGPLNMISDGILLQGDGTGNIVAVPSAAIPPKGTPVPTDQSTMSDTANITIYYDFLCPVCGAFEQTNGQQIGTWVSSGVATLEYHPVAFLDRASLGSRYPSRAANAAACVANFEPNKYFEATAVMFVDQPEENSKGLSNDEIISRLQSVGVTNENIASCVKDEKFKSWVTESTVRTSTNAVPNSDLTSVRGTPTVIVDGVQYVGSVTDAAAFVDFVNAVRTGTYVAPTS